MNPPDDLILQILADSNLALSPAVIAYNLDMSREHVNRRLSEFTDRGLVNRPKRGYYEIADRGKAYLAGEFNVDELESDEG